MEKKLYRIERGNVVPLYGHLRIVPPPESNLTLLYQAPVFVSGIKRLLFAKS